MKNTFEISGHTVSMRNGLSISEFSDGISSRSFARIAACVIFVLLMFAGAAAADSVAAGIVIDIPANVSVGDSAILHAVVIGADGSFLSDEVVWDAFSSSGDFLLTPDEEFSQYAILKVFSPDDIFISASLESNALVSASATISASEMASTEIEEEPVSNTDLFASVPDMQVPFSLSLNVPSYVQVGEMPDMWACAVDEAGNPVNAELVWTVLSESSCADVGFNMEDSGHAVLLPRCAGTALIVVQVADNPSVSAEAEVTVAIAEERALLSLDFVSSDIQEVCSVSLSSLPSNMSTKCNSQWPFLSVYDKANNCLFGEYVSVSVDNLSVLRFSESQIQSGSYFQIYPLAAGTAVITIISETNSSARAEYEVTVAETILSDISLPSTKRMTSKTTCDLSASVLDQYGCSVSSGNVVWSLVSGDTVLSLKSSGSRSAQLTPKGVGTAIVRATAGWNLSLYKDCEVTVAETVLSEISLSGSSGVSTRTTGSAYAYVQDQFGRSISDEQIVWGVGDSNILSISGSGSSVTLLPKGIGTTTIRATSRSAPSLYKERTVTVAETVVSSVPIYGSIQMSMANGGVMFWKVYASDQFGHSIPSEKLLWTIDHPEIASITETVDPNWYYVDVKPLSPGTATIRLTAESNASVYSEISLTVEETVPTSVYLQDITGVALGTSRGINADVCDQFGEFISGEAIAWSVSNTSVITLSGSENAYRTINALSEGTAVIRAESALNPDIYAEVSVSVEKQRVVSVELSESSVSATLSGNGESMVSINAWIRDQFGSNIYNDQIVWSIDNAIIAELSGAATTRSGSTITIIPKGVGTVTVRAASVSNSSVYAELTLTVEETEITSIHLPETLKITPGTSNRYSAYACDQFNLKIYGEELQWGIGNPSLLEISGSDGEYAIQAKAVGTTIVRAASKTHPSVYAEMTVTIEDAVPTSVSIYGDSRMSMKDTGYVYAYIRDQFGESISDEKIVWSVADERIITLSGSGNSRIIIPESVGSTTIRAASKTHAEIYQECTITIYEPILQGLSISASERIPLRTSITAYARLLDQFGSFGTIATSAPTYDTSGIIWSSSDESILVVSGSGRTVTLLPLAAGEVTVSASMKDKPEFSDAVTISIYEPIVTSLWVDSDLSVLTTKSTTRASASVSDQFGEFLPAEKVIWSVVSGADIVHLSEVNARETLITPLKTGTVVILVESASVKDVFQELTLVIKETTSISARVDGDSKLTLSSTGSARAFFSDQYGGAISEPAVWRAENESVVSFLDTETVPGYYTSNTVCLLPKASGTTKIHAALKSDPSITASMSISVEQTTVSELGFITLDYSEIPLNNTSYDLVFLYDQYENPIYPNSGEYNLIWSVSNETMLTVVGDENLAVLTPLGTGEVTLSVVSEDNSALKAEKRISITENPAFLANPIPTFKKGEIVTISGTTTWPVGSIFSVYLWSVDMGITMYGEPYTIIKEGDGIRNLWEVNISTADLPAGKYGVYANSALVSLATCLDPDGLIPADEITLSLLPGWNFLSIPKTLNYSANTAGVLFACIDTDDHAALIYNAETQIWEQIAATEILHPQTGYWIYAKEAADISLTYQDASTSPAAKSIYPGWNAVGLSAESSTPASSVLSGIEWHVALPWDLAKGKWGTKIINGGSGINSPDQHLSLGNGYWLYANKEGILHGLTA